MSNRYDCVIIGGGHNGLVAATLLARERLTVAVLERLPHVGGAAVSADLFPGVDARLSKYSYLVSLFPQSLIKTLGLKVEMRQRSVAAYTPIGNSGILMADPVRTAESMRRVTGSDKAFEQWADLQRALSALAEGVFPTMMQPLSDREGFMNVIGAHGVTRELFSNPLGSVLGECIEDDLVRGIVLTDGLIGTFASEHDSTLQQNQCFLYHVIGNGGRWDVPVGGMGAVTSELLRVAQQAGVEIVTSCQVAAIDNDGTSVRVMNEDGREFTARHALCNAAPAVLERLSGLTSHGNASTGAQLKINMLLTRLPKLRDGDITSREAWTGTFHVHESASELEASFVAAARGDLPEHVSCELYSHSLTDPSILSDDLRHKGYQALTAFALQMPPALFSGDHDAAKQRAVDATLRSIDSVLAEPLASCLARDVNGDPCVEALTPMELERELGMPGGNIFHRPLQWPFAETEDDVGRWGVETAWPNVWLCGAGARRGGGVSGIAGHNAAQAVLAAIGREG